MLRHPLNMGGQRSSHPTGRGCGVEELQLFFRDLVWRETRPLVTMKAHPVNHPFILRYQRPVAVEAEKGIDKLKALFYGFAVSEVAFDCLPQPLR